MSSDITKVPGIISERSDERRPPNKHELGGSVRVHDDRLDAPGGHHTDESLAVEALDARLVHHRGRLIAVACVVDEAQDLVALDAQLNLTRPLMIHA